MIEVLHISNWFKIRTKLINIKLTGLKHFSYKQVYVSNLDGFIVQV